MLYKRKNSKYWYMKLKYHKKIYQKSTRMLHRDAAERVQEAFRASLRGVSIYVSTYEPVEISREWRAECNRAIKDSTSWLARALYSANFKNRTRFKIEEMSKKMMLDMALKSNGKCAITKLPFTFEEMKNTRMKNPCCASIDRIDSQYGYTTTNCRFVLLAVNIAMSNWGEDIFWAISEAAVSVKLRDAAHIQVRKGYAMTPLDKHTVEPAPDKPLIEKGNGAGWANRTPDPIITKVSAPQE